MKKITFAQAISEALAEEMRRDDKVVLLGLEQGPGGAAFGATEGLYKEFGDARIFDTPIAEYGYTGISVGAAATGLRPVCEIQFNDWMTIASDQLINQAAFMRYMYGGKIQVPLVIRTNCGGYRSTAAQHSKMMESWFAFIPGLKVVHPSTPMDAKGLLKSAIRDNNPVVMFEHKQLYSTVGEVSEDPDFLVPIGKCDVKRPGKDVTIITYSYVTHFALQAAENLAKQGIDVEVVDLRTIKPLDIEGILASVRKTGRVLCLQETWLTCSVMSEVAAIIAENAMDALKTPLVRLGAKECPNPYNAKLEHYMLPSVESITEAVEKLVR
ncbi:MAG TPA: alpha-ketoacid dehydrogenase subunit beta [Candidatus Pullichristensenella excrementigallinarum]|uniref:Alpha-ketoacid dehydrogenase subunit beta n=1 Tax=Candidatus Pullichristensenella excrementigallinarum TaxID=2840907 RepID=A0A9D1LDH8_9FIRM|nr:alpha-ketoacid dehydrogenase subunit beta [Candidatus Pullichristensenella excrementigallinarum]